MYFAVKTHPETYAEVMERRVVLVGLIVAGLGFSVAAALTDIPAGGADNFAHFNISRWAFRYPHLFLDHWGKPVFTLLTAPFAQAGMLGVRIFNIACALLTAWFIYRLLEIWKLRYAWFAVFATLFTPVYFVMAFSGMTEVLFGLLLAVSIYLFFKEHFISSAIVISFIFLVRTEGLPFIFLFLIAYVVKRQYRPIPFLCAGFLLFSLIGWVFMDDGFFWLITDVPYATGETFSYGSGDWHHFLVQMPKYFGVIMTVFLFFGSFSLLRNWLMTNGKLNTIAVSQVLLVMGSFWGYFFIHSYLWWIGVTSAGLVRVMAGVSPLISIMAVLVLNAYFNDIRWRKLKMGAVWVLVVIMGISSASYYHRAVSRNQSSEILKRVSQWLMEPEQKRHKLVIHNPYFAFATGIDAWDFDVVQYGFQNHEFPEEGLPDSTLFVWDAHFSPNEGMFPLEKIMNNPNFELVRCFEPVIPFKVWGVQEYKVMIFRKIQGDGRNNQSVLQE